jgi:uncharacterized protein
MAWLLRDGSVLATAEMAEGAWNRTRGLIGRDSVDGAIVLRPCKQVHTLGMRFPIDVAFCSPDGVVLRAVTLAPWRLSRMVWRSAFVVEAGAGAFERWHLRQGDLIEIKGD